MNQTKTFRFEATPEFLSDDVINKFAEEFNSNVEYVICIDEESYYHETPARPE